MKYLISLFVAPAKSEPVKQAKKENLKIKQEDIIEAEFEEIENNQTGKQEN